MVNWEEIQNEWETSKITLAALAGKHELKLGTLKSRKSREGWSRDSKGATGKKDATKSAKDATRSESGKRAEQKNRSGNPNPKNRFTERNSKALKHGLFSRYMPKETLEIMGMVAGSDPVDLLWMQIELQFAAIIRAQSIMVVRDKDDIAKEVKKHKETEWGEEVEYEIQFAWDRQATFLNAQSKAMGELRSLIKQFDESAHIDDERRLKLQAMQVGIDKAKAEIGRIEGESDSEDDAIDDWVEAVTADE